MNTPEEEPPLEVVSGLVEYFRARLAEHPDSKEYIRGVEHARRFLALEAADELDQAAFQAVLTELESIGRPGSGYFELWLAVRAWGYDIGYLVPSDHPWRDDPNHLVCRTSEPFRGQLSIGERYRCICEDQTRGLVRVWNDERRLRWYPRRHFEDACATGRFLIRKTGD